MTDGFELDTDANPMMTRIMARQASDVRRRRSLIVAASAAIVTWILAGTLLTGTDWLIEILTGLGIAAGAGASLCIFGLLKFARFEDETGGPITPRRYIIGAVAGTSVICMLIFAVYHTYLDFEINQATTLRNLEFTVASFILAYPFGPRLWQRGRGARSTIDDPFPS